MPGNSAQGPDSAAVFLNSSTLGFIAYVIFPTLAVLTAVFGAILLARDNTAAGLLFFALMQLWVLAGIAVHIRRKRLLYHRHRTEDDGDTLTTE